MRYFFYIGNFFIYLSKKFSFEFVYFIGISGAIQALITPALGYDFPHYDYFFFFFEHGIVIWSGLYMVFVEKMKPQISSIFKAMLYMDLTGIVVLIVDLILKSNYMFLMEKPRYCIINGFIRALALLFYFMQFNCFSQFYVSLPSFLFFQKNER